MNLRLVALSSLAVVAMTIAHADTISMTLNPTAYDLVNGVLAVALDETSLGYPGQYGLNYIPVDYFKKYGIHAGSSVTISETYFNYYGLPVAGYGFFGVYQNGTNFGATIAYNSTAAATVIGSAWPFTAARPSLTEDFYLSDFPHNADTLDGMFAYQIHHGQNPLNTSDATLVDFSDGINGGSITNVHVDSVPEPAGIASLAGMLGLLVIRRRRG